MASRKGKATGQGYRARLPADQGKATGYRARLRYKGKARARQGQGKGRARQGQGRGQGAGIDQGGGDAEGMRRAVLLRISLIISFILSKLRRVYYN